MRSEKKDIQIDRRTGWQAGRRNEGRRLLPFLGLTNGCCHRLSNNDNKYRSYYRIADRCWSIRSAEPNSPLCPSSSTIDQIVTTNNNNNNNKDDITTVALISTATTAAAADTAISICHPKTFKLMIIGRFMTKIF